MCAKSTFKCLHCKEKCIADHRNRGRQGYCAKPACRRASKAASQRRWLSRPENADYFRGPANSQRVREWRLAHPGYSRNKKPAAKEPLQEPCASQPSQSQPVTPQDPRGPLQDVCLPQPALIVGLISVFTGQALQEDIAATARSLLNRGQDILRMTPRSPPSDHETQTHPLPPPPAPRAAAV
jgi:hypothetical protein